MAKKAKPTTETASNGERAKGFTGHHKDLLAAGATMTSESRPRGKPYKIEEWLTTDRKYRLVKAFDDGKLVAFEEVAQYGDPRAAAENLK